MRQQINSLQYCRALAATAVLAQHSFIATAAFVERPPPFVETIAGLGFLGVDFFFVLSGFIIMHAHMGDDRTAGAAARYAVKRLRRIYVPYLPVSLGLIALYVIFPSISRANREWGLFTSLTLFPTGHSPALVVAWTLIHEMMFYTLFLLSYFTEYSVLLFTAWAAGIAGAWMIGWSPAVPIIRVMFSNLNLEFVAGVASACAYSRLSARWWPLFIGSGLLSIIVLLLTVEAEPNRVWLGLALAPIVTGASMFERSYARAPWQSLLLVGNASYAIYLVHDPVVSVVIRLSAMIHSWSASLVLCMTSGLALGIAYHCFVEKPGIRLLTSPQRTSRRTASLSI